MMRTRAKAGRLLRQLQFRHNSDQQDAEGGLATKEEPEPPKQDYLSERECHRTYSCIHCRAHLANHDELISKLFQGNHGRAYLFNKVVNVGCKQAVERELLTGLHAVADIYCDCCETTLGWKYEQAFVPSQKYKEGKFIIELVHMLKENHWDLSSYNSKDLLEEDQQQQQLQIADEPETVLLGRAASTTTTTTTNRAIICDGEVARRRTPTPARPRAGQTTSSSVRQSTRPTTGAAGSATRRPISTSSSYTTMASLAGPTPLPLAPNGNSDTLNLNSAGGGGGGGSTSGHGGGSGNSSSATSGGESCEDLAAAEPGDCQAAANERLTADSDKQQQRHNQRAPIVGSQDQVNGDINLTAADDDNNQSNQTPATISVRQ